MATGQVIHGSFPLSDRGAFLWIVLSLTDRDKGTYLKKGKPLPDPVQIRALVDTGCETTTIGRKTLRKVGALQWKRSRIQTGSGDIIRGISRVVNLNILGLSDQLQFPDIKVNSIHVDQFTVGTEVAHAVIGLNALNRGLFTYNGTDRTFSLKFTLDT